MRNTSLMAMDSSISTQSSTETVFSIAPILSGLMNGWGWTDQRENILARDAQEISIQARWQVAEDHYQASPDVHSRANLIAAYQEAMAAAQQDYQDYQQK